MFRSGLQRQPVESSVWPRLQREIKDKRSWWTEWAETALSFIVLFPLRPRPDSNRMALPTLEYFSITHRLRRVCELETSLHQWDNKNESILNSVIFQSLSEQLLMLCLWNNDEGNLILQVSICIFRPLYDFCNINDRLSVTTHLHFTIFYILSPQSSNTAEFFNVFNPILPWPLRANHHIRVKVCSSHLPSSVVSVTHELTGPFRAQMNLRKLR